MGRAVLWDQRIRLVLEDSGTLPEDIGVLYQLMIAEPPAVGSIRIHPATDLVVLEGREFLDYLEFLDFHYLQVFLVHLGDLLFL